MKNLIRIVGRAPSEIDETKLTDRLLKERNRVSIALEKLRYNPKKKKTKAKASKAGKPSILKQIQDAGITVEEFLDAVKEI